MSAGDEYEGTDISRTNHCRPHSERFGELMIKSVRPRNRSEIHGAVIKGCGTTCKSPSKKGHKAIGKPALTENLYFIRKNSTPKRLPTRSISEIPR